MKCKLEVVRFRSEDVIATSGLLNVCRDYGTHYIYSSVEYVDHTQTFSTPAGPVVVGETEVRLRGTEYSYTAEQGLVEKGNLWANFGIDLYSRLDIRMGEVYHYVDGGKWPYALCVPQDH